MTKNSNRLYIIQAAIVGVAFVAVAIFILYGARLERATHHTVISRFTASYYNDAGQISFALQQYLNSMSNELDHLSETAVTSDPAAIRRSLSDAMAHGGGYVKCFAWVRSDHTSIRSDPHCYAPLQAGARLKPLFHWTRNNKEKPPLRAEWSDDGIVLLKEVTDDSGTVYRGFVAGVLDVAAMNRVLYDSWIIDRPDSIILIDDEGRILMPRKAAGGADIFRHPDRLVALGFPLHVISFFTEALRGKMGASWSVPGDPESPSDPRMNLIAYAPVRVGRANWAVAVVVSYRHFVTEIGNERRGELWMILLSVLMILSSAGALLYLNAAGVRLADKAGYLQREHDITKETMRLEKEYARKLETANVELRRLDDMKTNLIGAVSHDMRSPLTVIMGYLELIRSGTLGPLPTRVEERLGIVSENARLLRNLIDNYLDLAALQSGRFTLKREWIPLHQNIRQVVDMVKTQPGAKQLTFAENFDPFVIDVAADSFMVTQILFNLLSNAVKFTPPGGRITVASRRVENGTEFTVEDTGIGIPLEAQEKVFDRFYQVDGGTRRRRGGSGLGLAIVKEMVTAHGGKVSLRSEPGAGTAVTIFLPEAECAIDTKEPEEAAEEKAAPVVPAEAPPEHPRGKPSVLVVDDDVEQIKFLKDVFDATGYRLFSAETITEARRILRMVKVDVALLDLVAGEESGWDFLEEIKGSARTASIQVIVHSALPAAAARDKACALGAACYLMKPASGEMILKEIERVIVN